MNDGQKLGEKGAKRFSEIYAAAEASPSLLSESDQKFIESYNEKVVKYGADAFLSEKQKEWVKRIAEKLGV